MIAMEQSAPRFQQAVDAARPHTLLTANPKFSGSLLYRYDDTGETITVPHIWYNVTTPMRVAAVRADAQLAIDNAVRFATNPPFPTSRQAGLDIARRYRARAARIKAEADRMEAAWCSSHPVAAARLELDYGEIV